MRTRNADKEQLVKEKAIELIVKLGFEGFSMNKLASESGISVATLYIYYQDKDDLIKKIGSEIGNTFFCETLKDFSPEMSFRDGLRQQWRNRARFALEFPKEVACFEIIRHTAHGEYMMGEIANNFKEIMGAFFHNAMERKELRPITLEVFWSIAYGPLYTLLRFNSEGKSMGGRTFKLTEAMIDEAFEFVIRALTP
jgi:TetR/AcrR family transcriptional repressor of multidrug resistance operon